MKRSVFAVFMVGFALFASGCDCKKIQDIDAFMLGGKNSKGTRVKGLKNIILAIKNKGDATELCEVAGKGPVLKRIDAIYKDLAELGESSGKYADDAETLRDALDRIRSGVEKICSLHEENPQDEGIRKEARRMHDYVFNSDSVKGTVERIREAADCSYDKNALLDPRRIDDDNGLKRVIHEENSTPARPADDYSTQRAV